MSVVKQIFFMLSLTACVKKKSVSHLPGTSSPFSGVDSLIVYVATGLSSI